MTTGTSYSGGASSRTIAANTTLKWGPRGNRVQTIKPTAGSLTVKVPDATTLALGGPQAYIINRSALSHSFTLADNAGTTIAVVATGEAVALALVEKGTAAGVWWFRKTVLNAFIPYLTGTEWTGIIREVEGVRDWTGLAVLVAGVNTEEKVLTTGMEADGSDIEFRLEDDTILDFEIVSGMNTTNTTFRIVVPSLVRMEWEIIRMYSGELILGAGGPTSAPLNSLAVDYSGGAGSSLHHVANGNNPPNPTSAKVVSWKGIINPSSVSGRHVISTYWDEAGGGRGWFLELNGSKLRWFTQSGLNVSQSTADVGVIGTFTYVGWSWDGVTLELYWGDSGASSLSTQSFGAVDVVTYNANSIYRLGGSEHLGLPVFSGKIQDAALFDSTVSAAQHATMFSAGDFTRHGDLSDAFKTAVALQAYHPGGDVSAPLVDVHGTFDLVEVGSTGSILYQQTGYPFATPVTSPTLDIVDAAKIIDPRTPSSGLGGRSGKLFLDRVLNASLLTLGGEIAGSKAKPAPASSNKLIAPDGTIPIITAPDDLKLMEAIT